MSYVSYTLRNAWYCSILSRLVVFGKSRCSLPHEYMQVVYKSEGVLYIKVTFSIT